MALVLKDRVKVQTTTTGTGTLALSAAVTGFQSFSVIGDNVTYYTIQDPATGDWEVGYGTCASSGTTLSRDFVYDSSNSGNLVDFAAGTKEVFCTYPAEQAIYQETNGNLKLVGGVIGLTQDGTEGTTLPNTSFQAFTTGNYYMQANQQNLSSGAEASSDYICTADNGDDTDNYMDVGMASSGYNYAEYSAQKPNSGYILSTGSDLRLIAGKYGAETPGAQDIVLIAGSTKDTEERVRVYGDTGNVNIGGGVNATDLGKKLQVVGSASVSGAVTFGSTVTLNANPSAALQAATKQYVDQQSSTGIHIHEPCVSETSAALSAVYTQGGTTFNITDITGTDTVVTSTAHGLSVDDEIWLYSTAGNGLSINTAYFVYATPSSTELQLSASFGGALLTGLTNASGLTYATRANSGVGAYLEASANEALPISGVTTSDRVLVYGQSTGYWNGVYTVTALGSGGSKWKLTRATDANKYEPSNTEGLGAGDYFFIQSNSEAYVLTNPTGPVIIGYDAITYTLFSSVPAYTVNSPLQLVGTTLSLTTVPATLGGTGTSTTTAGDLLYSATANNWSKLAIGTSEYPLIVSGGLPAWGTLNLAGAGVSGVLPESHGGTNQSYYATGDTLYASAANTLSKLSGNTSTTKKYLNQTGTGSASQAPVWDTISATDIASGTLAVARGGTGLGSYAVGDIVYASGTGTLAGLADVATGNVLLSGGANTAPSYGKVNLGTHITGTLPVANGGTGNTSFTANGIAYASSASALATGSSLVFDGSNNIGLGNSLGVIATGKGLYIQDSLITRLSLSVGSNEGFLRSSASSMTLGNSTNIPVAFYVSNAEQMRLTSIGLGIGTTSPGYKLHVTSGGSTAEIVASNSVGSERIHLFSQYSAGNSYVQSQNSNLFVGTYDSYATLFFTANIERMRIDTSGNVGIGTSSPASKLDVSATGADSVFSQTVSGVQRWQTKVESATGNWLLYDQTGAATRLTMSTSGNLGLGVTPSAWRSDFKVSQIGLGANMWGRTGSVQTGIAANAYLNSSGSWIYQNTAGATTYITDGSTHAWNIAPSGTAGNPITFTQAMTLDASGRLLVGTTSAFDSNALIQTSGKGIALKNDWNGNNNNWSLIQNTDTGNNSNLKFSTASGSMTLDASGNLTVGAGSGTPIIYVDGGVSAGQFRGLYFKYAGTTASGRVAQDPNSGELRITSGESGQSGFFTTFQTNGTERMRIDSSGNVGIGTSSPSNKLDVNGVIRSYSSSFGYSDVIAQTTAASGTGYSRFILKTTDREWRLINDASTSGSPFIVYDATAAATRLTLDSSGNLGLGVTPSAWGSGHTALQVGNSAALWSSKSAASDLYLSANCYFDGGSFRYKNTGASTQIESGAGYFAFKTAPSGTAGNPITFTQAMTLDASGNLCVGITSPLVSGSNRGNITVNGSSSSVLTLGVNGTASGWFYADASNTYISCGTGSRSTVFETSAAERMRIDSSGNVGIGTSSPNGRKFVVYREGTSTVPTSVFGASLTSAIVASEPTMAFSSSIVAATGLPSSTQTALGGVGFTYRNSAAPTDFCIGISGTPTVASSLCFYNDTERMRIDSSGNLLFNSGYGSVAKAYGCRAWVNFNGTGTIAIRASGNVTDITDGGVGIYTVNFTTAMPDANYSIVSGASRSAQSTAVPVLYIAETSAPAAGSCRLYCSTSGNAATDQVYLTVAVFR